MNDIVKAESKEVAQFGDSVLERIIAAASNPEVDIDKFERLLALQEKLVDRQAEMEFNQAMTAAQTVMRPVSADATNPQTRSKYASYKALDDVLRPIYTAHGFSLSFNTKKSDIAENIDVICEVSHVGGFSKTYEVPMPADGKGAKGGDVMTKTHAAGSAMSYGQRYLLKLIFNVAVTTDDDDGNNASGRNLVEELLKYNELLREHWFTVSAVKKYLIPEWGPDGNVPNVTAAREAYKELSEADQSALWRAPTKGGIWETIERTWIKQPPEGSI